MRRALSLVVACAVLLARLETLAPSGRPLELHARHGARPAPKIDGVLDDELWSGEPLPLDRWMSYNPLRGEPEQQRTQRLGRLRRRGDLLRVPVLRRRAGQDPDDDQPPRQRVERRLGGRQPRLEPRRTDRVPHVHQPERHPDGRAAEQQRGHRASTGCGRAPARVDAEGYTVEMRLPLQSIRFRADRTSAWACCSSGATAASACRGRGRRWSPASGCSRRTRRWPSASCTSRCCSK